MELPRKVRVMIAGWAISGAATVAIAAWIARTEGLGRLADVIPLTLLLALCWAFPVLVLRTEETEAFQLDEPFFVASALLLPFPGAVLVFAAATSLGALVRRRPLVRATFNVGQSVTATGLGLAAAHLIEPLPAGTATPRALAAGVVGAAVFLLVNSAAVSWIISFSEGKRARHVFVDGLDLRLLVWAGGVALGLLAAMGAAAHSWALALAALPMAALNLIMREHARARRQTQRSQELLAAASQVHAAVPVGMVEPAVESAARSLLHCRQARLSADPPRPGELGVPIAHQGANRWLVVADPIGFEPLEAQRDVLELIAGIASAALDNARLLEEIRHRAIHDPLTDLPNKLLFMDRLEHALAAIPRVGGRLAVMFLDLDQFKVINDSLGHDSGDQVLLGVAARLQAALRQGDTAARLGGDEFAILCEHVDNMEDGLAIGERIRAAASGSSVANGVELRVAASVGVVMVDETCLLPAEALLQAADTAMYRAKERGRDRVEIFDDQLRDRAVARLETETVLRRAMDDNRLRVFYQPIVDMAGKRIVEAEALLRIETPAGAMLGPADFIEVAEESGLIVTIGVQVLEEACRQAVAWRGRFGESEPVRVAVNFSARQLSRVPVGETVKAALETAGCSPELLALELTETALLEAADPVREDLEELRKMGVTVGLDDFGTGYSSLAYLKRFPVDFLKIDRCFVAGLGHDPEDDAIVDAIIGLGRSLGLATVAEGVETVEQMEQLRALGCDRMQGYLFARPSPVAELDELLAASVPGGDGIDRQRFLSASGR